MTFVSIMLAEQAVSKWGQDRSRETSFGTIEIPIQRRDDDLDWGVGNRKDWPDSTFWR